LRPADITVICSRSTRHLRPSLRRKTRRKKNTPKIFLRFGLDAASVHIRTGPSPGGSGLNVVWLAVLWTEQIFEDTHGRYSTVV
jgi:hypothetical protein